MLEQLLIYWRTALLATAPLLIYYLVRVFKPRKNDVARFADFPQPEKPDPIRGHWPWIEKAAAEGEAGRSFGMCSLM